MSLFVEGKILNIIVYLYKFYFELNGEAFSWSSMTRRWPAPPARVPHTTPLYVYTTRWVCVGPQCMQFSLRKCNALNAPMQIYSIYEDTTNLCISRVPLLSSALGILWLPKNPYVSDILPLCAFTPKFCLRFHVACSEF